MNLRGATQQAVCCPPTREKKHQLPLKLSTPCPPNTSSHQPSPPTLKRVMPPKLPMNPNPAGTMSGRYSSAPALDAATLFVYDKRGSKGQQQKGGRADKQGVRQTDRHIGTLLATLLINALLSLD